MTAVPLDHPEGGGYHVSVGVSLGESLLAPGALPGHNRYVLACRKPSGSAASGARARLAPGAAAGAPLEAAAPAAVAPAAAIMSTSVAIDLICAPFPVNTCIGCQSGFFDLPLSAWPWLAHGSGRAC